MKPVHAFLLACILGAVLFAAGCTTPDAGDGATPKPSEIPSPLPVPDEVVLVDDTNEGQVIPVNETASIIIKLTDNPSTGYVWKVTGSEGLAITQDTYTPAETGTVGAAGVHAWTMEPRTTGLVTFSAVYYRPWEGEPTDDTYTISFYVVPAASTLITVTADENGKTVTVPEGDVVRITLEENPTTGYQWNAAVTGGAVIAADTYIMSAAAGQGMVGAGGTHEWFITFPDGADGTFDAAYTRPWEETAEGADTFTVIFTAA